MFVKRKMSRPQVGVLGILILAALLSWSIASAQAENRVLTAGVTVTGTLDAENVAQVYRFEGSAGQTVDLMATSAGGFGLALLVTDADGTPITQSFSNTSGTTFLDSVILPQDGTYYVTVLSAIGVSLPAGSSFVLTLEVESSGAVLALPTNTPEATTEVTSEATVEATAEETAEATEEAAPTSVPAASFTPGQILTTLGLEIALTWTSTANLDLEVRDPVGGSLRFATPTVASGGTFGVNVNSVCNTVTDDAPTETAEWPSGALPTGSYELLIYYQPLEDCPTSNPANFSIAVTLDGQALEPVEGTINPNETFISSFVVNADGTLTAGASGLYTDTTVLPPVPVADLLASAQPISADIPVEGIITSASYYQTYTFQGQADQLITISMDATSGSLDPLLLLLDANGNVIDSSDDIETGVNVNSLISNRRLLVDGTYTILATRYGKDVGGTEGGYQLLLTGPTGDLPQEVLNLGLPRGDIEISLLWNTNADLQLLVRDPRGDSVFDDTPEVPSGGRLGAAGNVGCRVSQTSPVSYIYWPEGILPAGLYEVEVWYQNACNDTRPVSFTLNILVNGQQVYVDTVQAAPDQRYLTSFIVDVNGAVQTGPGGFIGTGQELDAQTIQYQDELESALPIASGETLSGSITNDNKFDLYYFDGEAGDVVTISMEATAGRLDTTLFLIDPNGFQIAVNDDAAVGESTNSLIREFPLPEDGRYIIIATHFGMLYGGTTGAYNITFSRLS